MELIACMTCINQWTLSNEKRLFLKRTEGALHWIVSSISTKPMSMCWTTAVHFDVTAKLTFDLHLAYHFFSYQQKCLSWGHSDLWPLTTKSSPLRELPPLGIACTKMAEIWMLCAVWVGTVDRVNDKDPACTAETSAETRGFKITTSLRFNISGSLLSQTKNRNSAVTSRATDVGETTSQWWGQRPNEWRTQHH